jgi:oxygen-independent coproporphyrinogen-3 oxidase
LKSVSSIYLHFPFCQHLCNYCDFYKHKLESDNQVKQFEDLLDKQFDFQNKFLSDYNHELGLLKSFYIGGGTPSLWKLRGIDYISKKLQNGELQLDSDCEFTIEVDPDTWTEEEIDGWLSIGVNRFSVGSQAFSDKYIKIMDRTHLLEDVEKTIKYFSDRGLNYSVDLMLGLPNSEERNIGNEIRDLLKFKPNHISVYILKTRKNYPLNSVLPDDEKIREEYLEVSKKLTLNGFDHYEVSNFARDGFYSKHNIKYWNYDSVAGLGPNATGLLVENDKALRYQWKSVTVGVEKEELEGSSLLIEKLFLGLRFKNRFNPKTLFNKINDHKKLDVLFLKWKDLGYLNQESSSDSINLSALGYLMCDSLIDDIFKEIDF